MALLELYTRLTHITLNGLACNGIGSCVGYDYGLLLGE